MSSNGVKPHRNGKKTTVKTTATRKVPQTHGGALNGGGTPGNKGGSGRPTSAIREACAKSFADRMAVLEEIADGKAIQRVKVAGKETEMLVSADPADRIKAMDLLGKYGGLQKTEIGGTLGIDGLLNDLDRVPDDPE